MIVHRAQFVEPIVCRQLTDFWEQNCDLTSSEAGESAFFDQRVMHVTQVLARNPTIGRLLVALGRRMADELRTSYSLPTIFPDDVQLVKWWEGHEMRPHADMEHPGGTAHPTPWREYAGVVYLNGGYVGGELCFPGQQVILKPSTGDFVGFGGGLEYLHSVGRIQKGSRYTCPAWFTRDKRYRCPAFHRASRKYA